MLYNLVFYTCEVGMFNIQFWIEYNNIFLVYYTDIINKNLFEAELKKVWILIQNFGFCQKKVENNVGDHCGNFSLAQIVNTEWRDSKIWLDRGCNQCDQILQNLSTVEKRLKVLGNILRFVWSLVKFWNFFGNFFWHWANFYCCKGLKYFKNILAFRSHWV